MTVRSIDMQVLLPKISEANRSQPIQNQQNQTQQQQFAAQFQKQADIQRHQVQNSNKSEGSKITQDDQKNKSHDQRENHRKDNTEEETAVSAKDPVKGNLLDIKI